MKNYAGKSPLVGDCLASWNGGNRVPGDERGIGPEGPGADHRVVGGGVDVDTVLRGAILAAVDQARSELLASVAST